MDTKHIFRSAAFLAVLGLVSASCLTPSADSGGATPGGDATTTSIGAASDGDSEGNEGEGEGPAASENSALTTPEISEAAQQNDESKTGPVPEAQSSGADDSDGATQRQRSGYVPSQYAEVWSDEFETLSLGTNQNWDATYTGWDVLSLEGNADQCMKADPSFTGTGNTPLGLPTHRVEDGVLSLLGHQIPQNRKGQFYDYEAACGMISGQQSHAQTFGYWETRMRLPNISRGHHIAFWMVPENNEWPPELDLLEVVGSNPAINTDEQRFHYTGHYNGPNGEHKSEMSHANAPKGKDSWYTLGLEWTADTVTWYLDGEQVHQMDASLFGTDPMYFMVSPEISGNWPGKTDDSTQWPMEVQIDYVRIYQA